MNMPAEKKKGTSEEINEIICFTDSANIFQKREGKKATDTNSLRLEFESFLEDEKDGRKEESNEPRINEKKSLFPPEEIQRHESFERKFSLKGNSTVYFLEHDSLKAEPHRDKKNIFSGAKKLALDSIRGVPIKEEEEDCKVNSANKAEQLRGSTKKLPWNPDLFFESASKLLKPETNVVFKKTSTLMKTEAQKATGTAKHSFLKEKDPKSREARRLANEIYNDLTRKSARSRTVIARASKEELPNSMFLLFKIMSISPNSFAAFFSQLSDFSIALLVLFWFPISIGFSVPFPGILVFSAMFALALSICLHTIERNNAKERLRISFLERVRLSIFSEMLGLCYVIICWLLSFQSYFFSSLLKIILAWSSLVFLPIFKRSRKKLELRSSLFFKMSKSEFMQNYILKTLLIFHLVSVSWYTVLSSFASAEEIFPSPSTVLSTYVDAFLNFGLNSWMVNDPNLLQVYRKLPQEIHAFRFLTCLLSIYLLCHVMAGTLGSYLAKEKQRRDNEEIVRDTMEYLQKGGVQERLIGKVIDSYSENLERENEFVRKNLVLSVIKSELVQPKLKKKLLLQLYMETICNCKPLGESFQPETLKQIASRVKELNIFAGSERLGSKTSLYFIRKGSVSEYLPLGKNRIHTNIYREGDFFNIEAYFSGVFSELVFQPNNHTELLEVTREDLLEILRLNNKDFEIFSIIKDKILTRDVERSWVKNECRICPPEEGAHEAWACPRLRFSPNKRKLFSLLRRSHASRPRAKIIRKAHKHNALINQKKVEKKSKIFKLHSLEFNSRTEISNQIEEFLLDEVQSAQTSNESGNKKEQLEIATLKELNRSGLQSRSSSSLSSASVKKAVNQTEYNPSQSSILSRSEVEFEVPVKTKVSSSEKSKKKRIGEVPQTMHTKTLRSKQPPLSKSINIGVRDQEDAENEAPKPVPFEAQNKSRGNEADRSPKFSKEPKEGRPKIQICEECLQCLCSNFPRLGSFNFQNSSSHTASEEPWGPRQQKEDHGGNIERLLDNEWDDNAINTENLTMSRELPNPGSRENRTLEEFKRKTQALFSESVIHARLHSSIDALHRFEYYKREANVDNVLLLFKENASSPKIHVGMKALFPNKEKSEVPRSSAKQITGGKPPDKTLKFRINQFFINILKRSFSQTPRNQKR